LTKEFKIDTIDDPTYGQFLDVLNIIGVTEKQFRQDPEKALKQAKNLDFDECQKLLNLVSKKKINLRNHSLDVAKNVVGIAASFFLTESYLSITKQKYIESGYMNLQASRAGNSQVEKIMDLTYLSQDSILLNMQKSKGGN